MWYFPFCNKRPLSWLSELVCQQDMTGQFSIELWMTSFMHIVLETYIYYRSNSRERGTTNNCNIVTYIKFIGFSLLKKWVKIPTNMQIKMTPQTRHWKQWIWEGFGEEKPKYAVTLYHNAINPTLSGDKHHGQPRFMTRWLIESPTEKQSSSFGGVRGVRKETLNRH